MRTYLLGESISGGLILESYYVGERILVIKLIIVLTMPLKGIRIGNSLRGLLKGNNKAGGLRIVFNNFIAGF